MRLLCTTSLLAGLILATIGALDVWGYGGREDVSSISVSPNSELMAFSFGKKHHPVKLIELRSGEIKRSFAVEGNVSDLSFSPSGRLLAASVTISIEPTEGKIVVWDVGTGRKAVELAGAPAMYFLKFVDERTIAFNRFGEVHLWSIGDARDTPSSKRPLDLTYSADFPMAAFAMSQESAMRAQADRSPNAPIVVTQTRSTSEITRLPDAGTVRSLSFSNAGDMLAAVTRDSQTPIVVWSVGTWSVIRSFLPSSQPVSCAFSPDGKLLAVHLEDNTLKVYDLPANREERTVFLLEPTEQLLEAAEKGQMKRVIELIADGVDIRTTAPSTGRTPMLIAANEGHSDIVRLLLDAGADVSEKGPDGRSALMLSAEKGHTETVTLLLSRQAERHARDQQDRDALTYAAMRGNVDIVQLLANKEADIDKALAFADNMQTAHVLISKGAGVDGKGKFKPLPGQAAAGHKEIVALLLSHGARVDTRSWRGRTALMEAAEFGEAEIVRMLVEAGADVNAASDDGSTALILAARRGRGFGGQKGDIATVRILLEAGASVNVESSGGETPLICAASAGNHELVRALLDGGAEVNHRTMKGQYLVGQTALMAAALYSGEEIVKLLVEKGADVNAQRDSDGETALMTACRALRTAVVEALLDAGADVNVSNSTGQTALAIAEGRAKGLRSGIPLEKTLLQEYEAIMGLFEERSAVRQ